MWIFQIGIDFLCGSVHKVLSVPPPPSTQVGKYTVYENDNIFAILFQEIQLLNIIASRGGF